MPSLVDFTCHSEVWRFPPVSPADAAQQLPAFIQ